MEIKESVKNPFEGPIISFVKSSVPNVGVDSKGSQAHSTVSHLPEEDQEKCSIAFNQLAQLAGCDRLGHQCSELKLLSIQPSQASNLALVQLA